MDLVYKTKVEFNRKLSFKETTRLFKILKGSSQFCISSENSNFKLERASIVAFFSIVGLENFSVEVFSETKSEHNFVEKELQEMAAK